MRARASSLALVPLALLLAAPPAFGAQATDVPDAVDGDDPFDAHLELKFDLMRKTSLITRENFQVPEGENRARPIHVKEFEYQRLRMRLRPRLEVGVFHDLGIFVEWPIVLWDQRSTSFANGTNTDNSTVQRDAAPNDAPGIDGWPNAGEAPCGSGGIGGNVDGDGCWGLPQSAYNAWGFTDGQWESVRAGFDYPQLGVRWSPINDERDPTKPTVTLQADYNLGFLPLPVHNPLRDAATQEDPGPVAHGKHEFHFQIALAKRYLLLDPFFLLDVHVPFAASDAVLGYQVFPYGGFTLGMEIVPYENEKLHQKFAIQVSTDAKYFSEGRDYVEISDALGELTYRDDYMRAGFNLGLYFKAFQFGYIDIVGTAAYETPHYITTEDFGSDRCDEDPDRPQPNCGNGVVDLAVEDNERSGYFNPVYDVPGRRFRAEDSLRLQVMAHAAVTF
jgi:hypothetical protein